MTARICSIEGCEKPARARAWCEMHYTRWKRHGDPLMVVVDGPVVHGHASHGVQSPTHQIWAGMRQRCTNPNRQFYANYGGRGVTYDPRWDSFELFLADVGERPPNPPGYEGKRAYWSLDRIDNDGNYEPGNVRWATPSEQRANRRSAKSMEAAHNIGKDEG